VLLAQELVHARGLLAHGLQLAEGVALRAVHADVELEQQPEQADGEEADADDGQERAR
jgi:hypothetical protein